jgi:hypothetical protein
VLPDACDFCFCGLCSGRRNMSPAEVEIEASKAQLGKAQFRLEYLNLIFVSRLFPFPHVCLSPHSLVHQRNFRFRSDLSYTHIHTHPSMWSFPARSLPASTFQYASKAANIGADLRTSHWVIAGAVVAVRVPAPLVSRPLAFHCLLTAYSGHSMTYESDAEPSWFMT